MDIAVLQRILRCPGSVVAWFEYMEVYSRADEEIPSNRQGRP